MKIGFLIYDSRSGSTFLSKKLHEFDDIYVSAESAFASRIIDSNLDFNIVSTDYILSFLYKEEHFVELNLDRDKLYSKIGSLKNNNNCNYKTVINAIIELIGENSNSDWLIIKHPIFDHLNTIIDFFPECKFIHIVRDPRGVHNSKSKSINLEGKLFSNNSFKTSLKYNYKLSKAFSFEKIHPDKIYHIKYEELLNNTTLSLNNCLEFLGCSNSKSKNKSYSEDIGDRQKHLHTNVNSKAISKKSSDWKEELNSTDIKIISYFSRYYINKLQYEKIDIGFFKIILPFLYLSTKYIVTSTTNFVKYLVKNPELTNSKVNYFKSFLKR